MPAQNKCSRCNGTGVEPDWREVGSAMRAQRESSGWTAAKLAKKLHLSRAYISDLELGRRAWRRALREKYLEALQKG